MMLKLSALNLMTYAKILKTLKMNHVSSSTHAHTTQLVLTPAKNNGEKSEMSVKRKNTSVSLICHIKVSPLVMLLMMLMLSNISLKKLMLCQLCVLTLSLKTLVFMDKELVAYTFIAQAPKKPMTV